MHRLIVLPALCAFACTATGSSTTDSTEASSSSSSGTVAVSSSEASSSSASLASSSSGGGGDALAAGSELAHRLAGLWSGPATRTPLGDFAMMNVDFRDVTDHAMFGRVDLDAANNLRFAFWIETHGGQDTWIYRNGGYFVGLLRDTRTVLTEHDSSTGTYRFCALNGGCQYVDALYDFDGEDTLVFDVKVRGMQHVLWNARRVETRTLGEPFPSDFVSMGAGDAPFPEMGTLRVTVNWSTALANDADVWVLLSTTDCQPTGGCNPSRAIKTRAAAGSTTAQVLFDQIHAGAYKANAILDRNNNVGSTIAPDGGDGITNPNRPVTVPSTGEGTATLSVLLNP